MVPYGHTMNPILALADHTHLCGRYGFIIILSMWAHIGIMWAYRDRILDPYKAKFVSV